MAVGYLLFSYHVYTFWPVFMEEISRYNNQTDGVLQWKSYYFFTECVTDSPRLSDVTGKSGNWGSEEIIWEFYYHTMLC